MQQARERRGKGERKTGEEGGGQTAKNAPSPNCQLIQLKKATTTIKTIAFSPATKLMKDMNRSLTGCRMNTHTDSQTHMTHTCTHMMHTHMSFSQKGNFHFRVQQAAMKKKENKVTTEKKMIIKMQHLLRSSSSSRCPQLSEHFRFLGLDFDSIYNKVLYIFFTLRKSA